MNIKNTENKVKQVDSLLTTIEKVIKKHWIILSILLIGAIAYGYVTLSSEEIDPVNTEQSVDQDEFDDSTYVDEAE